MQRPGDAVGALGAGGVACVGGAGGITSAGVGECRCFWAGGVASTAAAAGKRTDPTPRARRPPEPSLATAGALLSRRQASLSPPLFSHPLPKMRRPDRVVSGILYPAFFFSYS